MAEVRAVVKSCLSSPEENVVKVLKHGYWPSVSSVFIDMELYDFNLHSFIFQKWDEEVKAKVPGFVNVGAHGSVAHELQICNIMMDISNGTAFIHGKGQVHRDLKPSNGKF
jgi:serine/threonine protein kinase